MKSIILVLIFIIPLMTEAREAISGNRFELLTGVRRASENSRGFWDKKFEQKNYIYGKAPARFLAKNYDFIPAGARVLDIGMGEGRNAVFLASKGYKVDGIDISSVAIKKARLLAREFDVRIETIHKNVKDYKVASNSLDAIICFYFVDRDIVKKLMKWLKPGGVIIYESFTMKQKKINKLQEDDSYLLGEGELLELFPGFRILKYEEPLHKNDFTASIIVQKPKN